MTKLWTEQRKKNIDFLKMRSLFDLNDPVFCLFFFSWGSKHEGESHFGLHSKTNENPFVHKANTQLCSKNNAYTTEMKRKKIFGAKKYKKER